MRECGWLGGQNVFQKCQGLDRARRFLNDRSRRAVLQNRKVVLLESSIRTPVKPGPFNASWPPLRIRFPDVQPFKHIEVEGLTCII